MAKMESKWAALKGKGRGTRYGLRCTKCDNRLLLVIEEPVKRQVHSNKAHHRRVIARCPICKNDYRLKLGSAN
jgi:uncharacterized protein with PIN domain